MAYNLHLNFPKQQPKTNYFIFGNQINYIRDKEAPKRIPKGEFGIGYNSVNGNLEKINSLNQGTYICNTELSSRNGVTKLEEIINKDEHLLHKIQFLSEDENLIKKEKIARFDNSWNYSHFIHTQNKVTGVENVEYKKWDKLIGGYKISPVKRTFAKNFKNRLLQKLGMAIATDSRGQEIPIIRNLGAKIFKLASK